jgi:hypothetical protein
MAAQFRFGGLLRATLYCMAIGLFGMATFLAEVTVADGCYGFVLSTSLGLYAAALAALLGATFIATRRVAHVVAAVVGISMVLVSFPPVVSRLRFQDPARCRGI